MLSQVRTIFDFGEFLLLSLEVSVNLCQFSYVVGELPLDPSQVLCQYLGILAYRGRYSIPIDLVTSLTTSSRLSRGEIVHLQLCRQYLGSGLETEI